MDHPSHTIRKFNRFELKYLITLRQAERFKTDLSNYLVPDEHGNVCGSYALSSLYYDSPDLRCYWEKVDGVKYRRKLRIRRYENCEPFTDETPVFLEIKQRIDRVTQKRRAVLTYKDALQLCNDRQIPDHAINDKPVLEEIYVFLWQYNLRPVSIVRYDRQAFIGLDDNVGLRVTFDTSLTAQTSHLYLHEPAFTLPILTPDRVVMEIKVNERIPYWLTELVAAHGFQMTRVSKYCRSLEATQDQLGGSPNLIFTEQAQDILTSTLSIFYPQEEKQGIQRDS